MGGLLELQINHTVDILKFTLSHYVEFQSALHFMATVISGLPLVWKQFSCS